MQIEEKAIKYVKFMKEKIDFNKIGYVYGNEELNTVLNIIEKQKIVIDEMAEYIDNITFVDEKGDYGCDFELLTKTSCKYNGNCKDCIKEYFYKKAQK